MAKKTHKAATQITIASTEDESILSEWVQRFWKPAVGLAVLIAAAVLGKEYVDSKAAEDRASSWNRLREDVKFSSGFGGLETPSAGVLASVADELGGTPAGPWARILEVRQRIDDGEYDAAAASLRTLQDEYPNHPLVKEVFQFGEDESSRTLQEHLLARMDGVRRWEADHASLFRNDPLPDDAPKIRLETSKGLITLGLYQEHAPKHAENFLKLCREGYYDGTLFHRIGQTFMIQGGDPNSRDGDPSTWGTGGPDYKIEPERSDLRHFRYVLAAAKQPVDTESSGSQFYITTGTPHHLDGVHTIFGAVLEGKAVVDEIAAGQIAEGTTDRPQDPVVVNATVVLE